MTPFKTTIATALAALALVGLNACDTSTPLADSQVETESTLAFTDIKAPKDFAFSVYNEIGLTVKLSITTDAGIEVYPNAKVNFVEADGDAINVLASFVTDANGEVLYDGANLSSLTERVGVQVYAAGIPETILWYTKAELTTLDRILIVNPDSYGTSEAGSTVAAKAATVSYIDPTTGTTIAHENHPSVDYQLVSTSLFVERSQLVIDPAWLGSTEITITALTDPSFKDEIWAHFMHTGAGYNNAFGYYWYKKSENPTGALALVNKVSLFDEISGFYGIKWSAPKALVGTVTDFKTRLADANDEIVIGFWLHSDYEQGNKPGNPIWYSNTQYNVDEHGAAQEFHHVSFPSLSDPSEVVLGIEDQTLPNSDRDFNDLVFIVDLLRDVQSGCEIDPTTCIRCQDLPYNKESRLAFEDKYPIYGDFDYNDVVVDVDYTVTTRQCNIEVGGQIFPIIDAAYGLAYAPQLVSASIDVTPVANGAEYALGFGIALDIAGATTTVDNAASSVIVNGSETIIEFFDFIRGEFSPVASTIFVNTLASEPGFPYSPVATFGADIAFAVGTPIPAAPLASVNPFIFKQGDVSDEIHFKGQPMTSRGVAQNLVGTPAEGHPYEDNNGIPWAVELAQTTQYPLEKVDFTVAYPQYSAWVQTGVPANWATTGVASELY
ncbi:MAG: LruC domain-containing protein [Fibrobacterales bacterium]